MSGQNNITYLSCKTPPWFGKSGLYWFLGYKTRYRLLWSPKWQPSLHSSSCSMFFHSGRISVLACLYLFSSVTERCLGIEARGLSLKLIRSAEGWLKLLWTVKGIEPVQYRTSGRTVSMLLWISLFLCSQSMCYQNIDFCSIRDFGWVRHTNPCFLTTVSISKLWDLGLLRHSCIKVLSQPMSGLHSKAVLLRVHHLTPVSCCCSIC